MVRKWRDACHAESVNGIPARGRPSLGDGEVVKSSRNGRQSISPSFSVTSSFKSHNCKLSPNSLPSSGHTSPLMDKISAPTTPSTLPCRTRTLSPSTFSVAKGPLSSNSALLSKSNTSIHASVSTSSQRVSPEIVQNSTTTRTGEACDNQDDAIEVIYMPNVEDVPRTNAANKRLRKVDSDIDIDAPASKRPRVQLSNGIDDECSRDSVLSTLSCDQVSRTSGEGEAAAIEIVAENVQTITTQTNKAARRGGRRRKSTGIANSQGSGNNNTNNDDALRRKLAVINAQHSKVKTTSQLVAELAQKSGDVSLARIASNLEEKDKEVTILSSSTQDSYTQSKKEHMEKFLKSQQQQLVNVDDDDDIIILENDTSEEDSEVVVSTAPPSSSNPTPILIGEVNPYTPVANPNSPVSNIDLLGIRDTESAEEILSRLPPLSLESVDEKDCLVSEEAIDAGKNEQEEDEEHLTKKDIDKKQLELVDKSVVNKLHEENIDCQNGNFDVDGRFREWHEVFLQKAYQDSPIVLLPYVMTDF